MEFRFIRLRLFWVRFLAILLFFSFFPITIQAEMFRVGQTVMVEIPENGVPQTVTAITNDAIAITLPENKTFLDGVEVLFKVPQEVAQWMDSVAWALYNDVRPEPTDKRLDYRGRRTTVGTFGDLLSLDIKIPLNKNNSIKQDAYSVFIDDIPDFRNNKIFIRLQLAMKGTPDSISESKFEVTVKPIYINKGKLNLTLTPPENEKLKETALYIDGEPTEFKSDGFFIKPGIHTVNITSDSYRNEVLTITIEQAKVVNFEVLLRDITPAVRVAAPANTEVYCDDKKVADTSQPLKVTQGKHTFRFVIGGYEITRTIDAVNGKSYTVSLNVDATVKEEE